MPIELIIMIISLIIGAIGIICLQKGDYFLRYGKTASVIAFSNEYKSDSDGDGAYYPTVRFLTDNQVWITQELNIGFKPALREGAKLDVIYDPEEPSDVQIKSTFILMILPRILVAASICGLIFAILEVFDVISFID